MEKIPVFLAQSVNKIILRRANLSPPTSFAARRDVTIPSGMVLQIPYLDDLYTLSTSAEGANEATRRTCDPLTGAVLPVEYNKTFL